MGVLSGNRGHPERVSCGSGAPPLLCAKKENGGYRYLYGNMFYARVVEETLQFHREKNKMEITTVQKILMSATAGLFLYIMLLETFMTDSDSTSRVFKMSVRCV